MHTLFISYSSQDRNFVKRLANDLKKLDIGVWVDFWEIKVGDSIVEKIESGIKKNDYLGLVLSPNSVKSEWVRRELSAALMKELKNKSVVILPILLETCEIPPLISDKKYADFRRDYDEGLRDLLKVLNPKKEYYKPKSKRTLDSHNEEITHCWNIFTSPFEDYYTKEAMLERLIRLKDFKHLKEVISNAWTSESFKERALVGLAKEAKGNEEFLLSVIKGAWTSNKFREIALDGLIRAKANNYLLKLIESSWTPEWIRKRVTEYLNPH